jgi:succinate dehydrogenase / fumarate reductase membrane anchor subunit
MTKFDSGRLGRGAAYVSDPSGSRHAKFMQLSARALIPLGLLAAWFVVGVAGKSYEAAHAYLGRPFPAIALIAFVAVAMPHAAAGAETIIEDYVHDDALKRRALAANRWAAKIVALAWVAGIVLIAAAK